MASYLPPYLTRVQGSAPSQKQSESITYDYSGQDEINKRKDEASQLASSRYGALYSGDVAGSVGAGQRIRSLLSSLKDITPVRISSYSSSSDMDGGSGAIEGHHDSRAADGGYTHGNPGRPGFGKGKKGQTENDAIPI